MSTKKFEGEIKVSKFQWEINVDCFKDKIGDESVLSPKFSTDFDKSGNEWQLVLYPKGDSTDIGSTSLYLMHLTENWVSTQFHFSVLNQNNDIIDAVFLKADFDGIDNWGRLLSITENFILDPQNNMLQNELKILCKIIVEGRLKVNETENKNENTVSKLKKLPKIVNLLNNQEFSDIIIMAEEKKFYLHKCILANSSKVFEAMFRNDMKEKSENIVKIEDIRYEVLQEFFHFIYTEEVNDVKKIICELLTAVEKYCVVELIALCEEKMSNNLSHENVIEYYNAATLNNAENVKSASIKFMSLHIEGMLIKPEFDEFGMQHPEVLLKIIKNQISI